MLLHSSGSITRIFPNLLGHALRIIAPPRRAAPGNLALALSLARARSLFLLALTFFSLARATHWATRTHPCTESPPDDGPHCT